MVLFHMYSDKKSFKNLLGPNGDLSTIEPTVYCIITKLSWKFHKCPLLTLWVMLLTDKQTNACKNMTSLVEV